jgi:peptidyl-prolyl cis-trans isomerase B (cyclophilin B)
MKKAFSIIQTIILMVVGVTGVVGVTACGSAEQKPETSKKLYASIEIGERGIMWFELYSDKAPNVTAHFVKLANDGFYDGLLFWRISDLGTVQSGCPNNDGTGHSGKLLKEEIDTSLHHVRGTLSMIRMGSPWTTSSQFLICKEEAEGFDGYYTVIGKLIRGDEILDEIEKDDKIKTITIQEE